MLVHLKGENHETVVQKKSVVRRPRCCTWGLNVDCCVKMYNQNMSVLLLIRPKKYTHTNTHSVDDDLWQDQKNQTNSWYFFVTKNNKYLSFSVSRFENCPRWISHIFPFTFWHLLIRPLENHYSHITNEICCSTRRMTKCKKKKKKKKNKRQEERNNGDVNVCEREWVKIKVWQEL